jgi:hypothetical protein
MVYTRPEALQRVCEEVERTAWVSDRQFFHDHPQREYRLRPAMPAEIAQQEVAGGKATRPCSKGTLIVAAVKRIGPGIRSRAFFVGNAVIPWADLSEEDCCAWHTFIRQQSANPAEWAQAESALASLNFTEKKS